MKLTLGEKIKALRKRDGISSMQFFYGKKRLYYSKFIVELW